MFQFVKEGFLFSLFLIYSVHSFSYIAAADLRYECRGTRTYKFYLDVYFECGTDQINPATFPTPTLVIESESLGLDVSSNINFTLDERSDVDFIPVYCPSKIIDSTNCGDGTLRGLERVTFEGEYSFKDLEKADDFIVHWTKNYRSKFLTTINTSNDEPFYVEAIINTKDFSCNNSPDLDLEDPIITATVGSENEVKLLMIDPDEDELSYEIVDPRVTTDIDLPYKSGYSAQKPISSSTNMTISNDGVLKFTPTAVGEISQVDLIITETKDGKVKGQTSRTIQINTFDPTNTVPELSGFNGGDTFEMTFCVGDTITPSNLFVTGIDEDVNIEGLDKQNLSIEVLGLSRLQHNGDIEGDTINIENGIQAGFRWVLSDFDAGVYDFSIRLKDDGCPISQEVVKDYTLQINARPSFSLGDDFILDCDDPKVLKPEVTIGSEPATYTWIGWKEVYDEELEEGVIVHQEVILSGDASSFSTTRPDSIGLIVEDGNGCVNTDYIILEKNMLGNLLYDDWCFGQETFFYDTAFAQNGEIIKRDWYFGNGDEKLDGGQEETYTYPEDGVYEASVVIEDEFGCVDTLTAGIELCIPPKFEFEILNNCNNEVRIADLTTYGSACFVDRMIPSLGNYYGGVFQYSVKDKIYKETSTNPVGEFPFSTTAELKSGCVMDTAIMVEVKKSPTVFLEEGDVEVIDFAIRCNDPDTTLKALLWDEGHGVVGWNWEGGNGEQVPGEDTAFYARPIKNQEFWVTVVDQEGCQDLAEVEMTNDLLADFTYNIVCTLGETVIFNDSTDKGKSDEVYYKWDFGDGKISEEEEPQHKYENEGDRFVTLVVEDSYACEDSITKEVFYTFPKEDDFSVITDETNTVLCAENDTLYVVSPFSSHMDTLVWNSGEKSEVFGGDTIMDGVDYFITYDQADTYQVSLEYWYNYNFPASVGDSSCYTKLEDTNEREILSSFSGSIDYEHLCVGDSAKFSFIPSPEDTKIESIQWTLKNDNSTDVILDTSALSPVIFFDEPLEIDYTAFITDIRGCNLFEDSEKNKSAISVEEISPGYIVVEDTACFGDPSTFDVRVNDSLVSVLNWFIEDLTTDKYILNNANSDGGYEVPYIKNTLVTDGVMDGIVSYTFSKPGINILELNMSGIVINDKSTGESRVCENPVQVEVYVAPIPEPDFTIKESVCAGDEPTIFVNQSSVDTTIDKIESYLWVFENGDSITVENPSYLFTEGGYQPVSLTVFAEKCSNSKLSTNDVYVNYQPTADFTFDVESLEAYIPISFEDKSVSPTELGGFSYDFGDGNSTDEGADVEHIYDSVSIYDVKHVVITKEGCTDTIVKSTDLNTYLDMPTAFSPNGDGVNDEIGLYHKAIKEVYEYKIFNRWGQVVFDGGDDPDQVWDGRFKGADQELGVYVVLVKGRGAYDTEFEFKKNITLLR